jgi:hypothetical protein
LNKQENSPDFSKLDKKASELNKIKKMNLGKGQITSITSKEIFEIIRKELECHSDFLIKGK